MAKNNSKKQSWKAITQHFGNTQQWSIKLHMEKMKKKSWFSITFQNVDKKVVFKLWTNF
jgi:hypothetical protein